MTIHRRLEERLAAFKGTESALLFGSGYLANIGVVGALARRRRRRLLRRAQPRLDHRRLPAVARRDLRLRPQRRRAPRVGPAAGRRARRRSIVTESVFSMDGDVAPLEEIVELAQRYDVRVVVDEAHATGCVGAGGRGAVAEAGLEREVDVVVGTLGKALGSYGAFVACDAEIAQLPRRTRARPFIFSTAPPPPAVAGALAALDAARGAAAARRAAARQRRGAARRARPRGLRRRRARRRRSCRSSSATRRRRCASARRRSSAASSRRRSARRRCRRARSRLRLAVMASHTKDELREAARVLGRAALQAGFRPGDGDAGRGRPRGRPRRRRAAQRAVRRRGAATARRPRVRRRRRARRSARRAPCAAASSPGPTPAPARPSSPPRSCAAMRARGSSASPRSSRS